MYWIIEKLKEWFNQIVLYFWYLQLDAKPVNEELRDKWGDL